MAIPDFQTLMLPVLTIASEGQIFTHDLIERIEEKFDLSDEERNEMLPSGRQRVIANRTHWAVAYLFKAGLLDRPSRGLYEITDEGNAVLSQSPDRIDLSFLTARYESIRQFREKSSTDTPQRIEPSTSSDTPQQVIENAIEEINALLAADLLIQTRALTPKRFELLILDLMTAMGYGAKGESAHIGKAGDGGIDGTISEDKLGLDVVYLQAKCYKADNKVTPEQVRGFIGALSIRRATKGVFVTTSSFTKGAEEEARMSGHRIILIDGERLAELMVEYGVGVRTTQTLLIRQADPGYFEET